MRDTLIINLLGGPGIGKSTTMADVFRILKEKGYEAEMVTEFAKQLVWESRTKTFTDEVYIYAKQAHFLFMVKGEVDVIVTDRPLLLTLLYNDISEHKSPALEALCLEQYAQCRNLNFMLRRDVKYVDAGRNQTEQEAMDLDERLMEILRDKGIPYTTVSGINSAETIVELAEPHIRKEAPE